MLGLLAIYIYIYWLFRGRPRAPTRCHAMSRVVSRETSSGYPWELLRYTARSRRHAQSHSYCNPRYIMVFFSRTPTMALKGQNVRMNLTKVSGQKANNSLNSFSQPVGNEAAQTRRIEAWGGNRTQQRSLLYEPASSMQHNTHPTAPTGRMFETIIFNMQGGHT